MSVQKSLRGKKNYFVVVKASWMTRWESVKDAIGHGKREFPNKSATKGLIRAFKKAGYKVKVVRAQATI